MSHYTLTANVRTELGKGASRRLRRKNEQVAAIIYGGEAAPQPITIDKPAFYKAIEDEAFSPRSSISRSTARASRLSSVTSSATRTRPW